MRAPLSRLFLSAILAGTLAATSAGAGYAQAPAPLPEGPNHRSPKEGGHIGKQPKPKIEEQVVKPRAEEKKPQGKAKPRQKKIACSFDSMPAAERRRLEAQGRRIRDTQGLSAALRFARQSGANYRKRLEAMGVCPKR